MAVPEMNSDRKPIPLRLLIGGGLTVWAAVCLIIHGPVIAFYIALQLVTSGIFVWEMRRVERKALSAKLAATIDSTGIERQTQDKAA